MLEAGTVKEGGRGVAMVKLCGCYKMMIGDKSLSDSGKDRKGVNG